MTPVPTGDSVRKKTTEDFCFGKAIGEGSFSTVYLAKDIHTNKEYAIKVLEKRHIIREKKMEYVMREKNALQLIGNSSYFVNLYCTFQDTERLYFVLTYAKNGELLTKINKHKKFDLATAKYYTAEIVLALETLHSKGIIHRDLKPENILFDENWHILITDFGSAKILKSEPDKISNEAVPPTRRKNSFVGTAQYVSPEILNGTEATFASDLWAMGCILYQMISGEVPFSAGTDYLIFQKILKLEYEFPESFDKSAKDFVEQLLVLQPDMRLGAEDTKPYTSIRNHKFFSDINFDNLGPVPCNSNGLVAASSVSSIPEYLEPGFNQMKAARLQFEMVCPTKPALRKKSEANKNIANLMPEEIERRLEIQQQDKWHQFVEGNLILKQGFLNKRKGLFPRKRMFLLTLGPHLYYVDPTAMVLKGQVPWHPTMTTEVKNFKTFFIHTPNRTYYLEDPEGYALEWCRVLDEVKAHYFPK